MKKEAKYKKRRILFVLLILLGVITVTTILSYKHLENNSHTSSVRIENKRATGKVRIKDIKIHENKTAENAGNTQNNNAQNSTNNNVDNSREIPVLMYHSIGYEKGNDLVIKPETLEDELKYLKANNFTTINLSDLYEYFSGSKSLPDKPIVLTFDDGYENNYTLGYPLFKKYGVKANIFVITSWLDKDKNILTSNQIQEMDKNGIEVESHTFNHDELNKLPYAKQVDTLKKSKDFLEKALNRPIRFIAYPFGHYNQDTIRAATDTGYKMAFLTQYGFSKASQGLLKLSRIRISAGDSIRSYGSKINKPIKH